MARLIFISLLVSLSLAASTFQLEEVEKVPIYRMKDVTIESKEDPNSQEMWVVGHFQSDKIIVKEGRFGDRKREGEGADGYWVQVFTFISGARVGETTPVEFWYLKPHFAEQYFNDPNAYAEVHGKTPKIKIIEFEVKASEDTEKAAEKATEKPDL
ncbi:unnamed protein product [Blepharisma stoltei]|uniref:Uncharacterized protein n=1 Tax=Blepharisma stoltei TaxID=1481888 RepID=A0AAU9IR05_9CILI|nr:unnamed protein product [Blepharisma stoltei]